MHAQTLPHSGQMRESRSRREGGRDKSVLTIVLGEVRGDLLGQVGGQAALLVDVGQLIQLVQPHLRARLRRHQRQPFSLS